MYYGFTESESFADPTILNQYKLFNVIIEKRSDGKGYWHIFILTIQDYDIEKAITDISASLKSDWNAVFFNYETVYCLFKNKIFKLPIKKKWNPEDYEEVKKYAKECNVGNLDMNEVFKHYNELLAFAKSR